jgi:long-chain acyl-CoA synthetase
VEQPATGTTAGPTTLAGLFWDRAATSPDDLAYRHLAGPRGRGAWEDVTWSETRALVEPLAAGLVGQGVEPGDRVVVLSRTRIDWVLGHLAILCAGAATVAVHPGRRADDVARLVDGSRAVVVLAEDLEQVEKLRRVRGDIRTVRRVVLFDGDHPDRRVITFEALLSGGEEVLTRDASATIRRVAALRPDELATVLHPPDAVAPAAGVLRTHAAWVAEGAAAAGRADPLRALSTPLTQHGGHVLLAAQLTRGCATVIGGGGGSARGGGRAGNLAP